MPLQKYIESPFGVDYRDSVVRKPSGVLAELENLMLDQGSLQVRNGLTRYYGSSPLEAWHKVLALHRFYGFDTRTGITIEEFYAAINDGIKRSGGGAWTSLTMPSTVTMTADKKGTFKQMKDRTYYSNGVDPVLMIKKEDTQVYEAGIPDPDVEKLIVDCETLTGWTGANVGGLVSGNRGYYLETGFDKHTRGDYAITLEVNDSLEAGSRWFELWYTLPTALDLTTFEDETDSSLNDYIAIDIFRFQKDTIDEVTIEFSSSDIFGKGFGIVVYQDSTYNSYSLPQRTMLAEWAMNPYSNKLFFGRFRKAWFMPIDADNEDDWSAIKYFRVKLRHNFETESSQSAKITIDNIRLLKTPPMPAVLNIQVATCDAIEPWTKVLGVTPGIALANDPHRASQGASCKIVPPLTIAQYVFPGVRDLKYYNEGTEVEEGDAFMFDIVYGAALVNAVVILHDVDGRVAWAPFNVIDNLTNVQERKIYKKEFRYGATQVLGTDGSTVYTCIADHIAADGNKPTTGTWAPYWEVSGEHPGLWISGASYYESGNEFNWEQVAKIQFWNPSLLPCYIDNFRITRSRASMMINNFIPLDLTVWDTANRAIDHFFGENPVVDFATNVSDFLFKWYANITRRAVGQGTMVFPEYTGGRYRIGEAALPSLQMNVDAGGQFSVEFVNDNDLTVYEAFNIDYDKFRAPKESSDNFLGITWVEIEGQPSDEISIWMRSPDIMSVSKIRFRFYCDANADYDGASSGTHDGLITDMHVLYDSAAAFSTGMVGKRVVNETTGEQGIIGPRINAHRLMTIGVTWNSGDSYSINGYSFTDKPTPSADNYYEHVIDISQLAASLNGVAKTFIDVAKTNPNNEEVLDSIRDTFHEFGVYNSTFENGVWQGIMKWKRSDMVEHFDGTKPWSSMQCIASHSIIVEAVGQKNCTVNFQDWKITKTGAVNGELVYKLKLEDDQGWSGPASELSKKVTAKGDSVNISEIYVPDDTRITRKRLYRSDSSGTLRYLDTIDREETTYLDNIPEELLGEPIGEDFFKPPKANIMEVDKNSMIYANVIDRKDRYRPSRIYISEPFAPHQCSDARVFDVMPEDGQEITGVKWHYGYYIVWKTKSMYTVDPDTFQYVPRDEEMGMIAPDSLSPIPGIGFGWLSSDKRVLFGDHSNINQTAGLDIKDAIKGYSLSVLKDAVGFYHNDYYFIFLGDSNEKGYACYIPTMKWFHITGWNVWCTSRWTGKGDSGEIYAGSANGYVNKLFDGNTDISDHATVPVTADIESTLTTLDYDFGIPHHDKYHQWVTIHVKSLSDDAGDNPRLIVTPIVDQLDKSAYKPVILTKTTYKQFINKGYDKDYGTLIGVRINGKKRYALRDLYIEAGDLGWRPQK